VQRTCSSSKQQMVIEEISYAFVHFDILLDENDDVQLFLSDHCRFDQKLINVKKMKEGSGQENANYYISTETIILI
jgi:hypothetical protein